MKIQHLLIITAVAAFSAIQAMPDEITIGNTKQQGTFEGVENSLLVFRTGKDNVLKENGSKVLRITLDSPCKATITYTSKKPDETVLLKGYEKLKFTIGDRKKERTVFAATVKQMTVQREAPSSNDGESGGMGGIIQFDFNTFEAGLQDQELTAAQKTALQNYKSAKTKFDVFVNESTVLQRQMDKSTDAVRENLLNQLRKRKNEEQPIRNALLQAQPAFFSEFKIEIQPPPPGKNIEF